MSFLFQQILGTVLATALLGLRLYVPGWFLLHRFPLLRRLFPVKFGAAVLISLAITPITDYFIVRLALTAPFVALTIVAALAFFLLILPGSDWLRQLVGNAMRRIRWRAWPWFALWLGVILLMQIDVPVRDKLHTSTTVFDWAKHVMVADAIARTGLPPINPALYPSHPVQLCYYYLWHLTCAVSILPGITSARDAVLGSVFWIGIGLLALFRQYLRTLHPRQTPDRNAALAMLLLVGNMASLLLALRVTLHLVTGTPLNIDFLSFLQSGSEPIFSWLNTLLTAPHHAAAAVMALTGFLALRRASLLPERARWFAPLLAGFAFASAGGASIWVGAVAAAIGLVWCIDCLRRHERGEWSVWWKAALVAAVLLVPFALELRGANELTGSPLTWRVRGFTFTNALPTGARGWADLLCLPLNYTIEFGFPLLAAILAWRISRKQSTLTPAERFARAMFWTSLIIVSFVASAVRHNDFGWRAVMFAQFACTLWAWPVWLALVQPRAAGMKRLRVRLAISSPRLWNLTRLALVAGILSATIDPLMLRFGNLGLDARGITTSEISSLGFINDKQTAKRLANYHAAYDWISTHTPRAARVLLNPDRHSETVFFLYANRQAIASDLYNSTLFGLNRRRVEEFNRSLIPLFGATPSVSWPQMQAALRALGAGYVVLRSEDPAWGKIRDWPEPVYRNEQAAVYETEAE